GCGPSLAPPRKDLRVRVDGGGVRARVRVGRRPLRHAGVHVRDGHKHPRGAARVHGDGELVEVARVVVVDRAPEQIARVANRAIAAVGLAGRRLRLRARGRRELGLEAALDHRAAGDLTETLTGVGAYVHGDDAPIIYPGHPW